MDIPAASDHAAADEILQDVATFLDEGFRPRQLPNPAKCFHWARSDRPLTRILEPREYPTDTLLSVLELVEKAGTVPAAQAALRTAVAYRKSLVTQGSLYIQVLPRDFKNAMKSLNDATTADNDKPTPESPPPAMHPQKQRALNESTPNGKKSCPSVVKRMEDVPEALAKTLRIMSNLQKGPASRPEVARRFNSEQSESELYALHINCTTILRASSIQDEEFGIRQGTEAHSRKHWQFKLFANEASKLYKKLSEETGLVLSKPLRNIFETPLQCCANNQAKESSQIKPQ
ncbi:uncharacterized protein J3D65DRAFT_687885 [Phyllosticta citribraziliensis]|uniref:Uncharacterized protein n=1 Tax=Phyllosticta citribraziliensis TaxID=989973 RepID=A0ABR1L4P2_9PEZI